MEYSIEKLLASKTGEELPLTYLAIDESGHYPQKFAYVSAWSTNLSMDRFDNAKLDFGLDCKFALDFSISEYGTHYALRYQLAPFFRNSWHFQLGRGMNLFCGRQIFIRLATDCKECAIQLAPQTIEEIVGQLRLVFGLGAAVSEGFSGVVDYTSGDFLVPTEGRLWAQLTGKGEDESSLERFVVNRFSALKPLLKRDSQALFSRAVSSELIWERFLFLWIAIEIETGSGRDRKAFALEALQSELINDEIRRLHHLRGQVAHEGNREIAQRDCVSALWVLRLTTVSDSAMKSVMVSEFERWISASHDQQDAYPAGDIVSAMKVSPIP
ncbi:hypothetical protein [Roseobacter sp. MH60115]|uniref:hypothetical protein n=1 Tax=Roseobacter sp. MH60115 TaxID=2785324 RepID=UPI0018A2DB48|nr:hypothetical protein [Roseobacter sp. MH60115]